MFILDSLIGTPLLTGYIEPSTKVPIPMKKSLLFTGTTRALFLNQQQSNRVPAPNNLLQLQTLGD